MDYDFGETNKDVIKIVIVCGTWHKGLEITKEKAKDPDFEEIIKKSVDTIIKMVIEKQEKSN